MYLSLGFFFSFSKFVLFFWLSGMQDLSSSTRDGIRIPCSGSTELQSLYPQGISSKGFSKALCSQITQVQLFHLKEKNSETWSQDKDILLRSLHSRAVALSPQKLSQGLAPMTSVTRTNLAVQSSIWFIRQNAEQMLLCQHWRSPRAPGINHRAWARLGAGGAPLPGPQASREGRLRES